MDVVKEFLLQVMMACLPAVLYPLSSDRPCQYWNQFKGLERVNARIPIESHSKIFLVISMISVALCSLFSIEIWEGVPLNLSIIPLFSFLLYGQLRHAIILALFQIGLYPFFTSDYTLLAWILETGLIFYPMILLHSNRFKSSPFYSKFIVMILYCAGSELLSTCILLFLNSSISELNLISVAVITLNAFITIFLASLFTMLIESTLEKDKLSQKVMQLSQEYFREAEKLQQMMDAAPLSIILLDQQRSIVAINDTLLQLYRMQHPTATRDDLLKQSLDVVLAGFHIESMMKEIEQTFQGQSKSNVLLHDTNRIYLTGTSPLQKGETGEVIGAVIIIQDITELETLRKEFNHVERLSLVGKMAAGITHEIRNPMSVVKGFLQLMREKSPANLDHYYRIVMEELDRANSIINDFLALAQNRVVDMSLCDLHDIIRELTPLLWADANLRGQIIEVNLDENIPQLMLNNKEIKQLILNLSRNGMEAMGDKGSLVLETRLVESGVEMIVKDMGSGIPATMIQNLFEPFFTTKTSGTGLGLSLCLSIMKRHGGSISVDSKEGVGTQFVVFFPLPGMIQ